MLMRRVAAFFGVLAVLGACAPESEPSSDATGSAQLKFLPAGTVILNRIVPVSKAEPIVQRNLDFLVRPGKSRCIAEVDVIESNGTKKPAFALVELEKGCKMPSDPTHFRKAVLNGPGDKKLGSEWIYKTMLLFKNEAVVLWPQVTGPGSAELVTIREGWDKQGPIEKNSFEYRATYGTIQRITGQGWTLTGWCSQPTHECRVPPKK